MTKSEKPWIRGNLVSITSHMSGGSGNADTTYIYEYQRPADYLKNKK